MCGSERESMQTLQRRLTAVLVVLVGFCFAPDARTQTLATINEAQARDWAAYAAQKAAGDQKTFDEVFKNLARIVAPSYRADPFSPGVTLYSSNALDIVLIGQVSAFQSDVSEAVRKMTPIDKTLWPCGASVYVFPSRIDSPDIERIVVKR